MAMTVILEGIPAGLIISPDDINIELKRRQKGYGRGGRMEIESDTVKILSGIRWGKTIGSPITLLIENRDWSSWKEVMDYEIPSSTDLKGRRVTKPRPGHADLPGSIKYNIHDIRDVLERSSARETVSRVAAGAVAKRFLSEFGIKIISYVIEIGRIRARIPKREAMRLFEGAEASVVRCPDRDAERQMIRCIDEAKKRGDSLGGVFEVIAIGVPVGLGSYVQWDKRLNARLAHAIMGIQAIKGVEIGLGFEMARRHGSEVMDEIFYRSEGARDDRKEWIRGGFFRKTNNAGGIEGGISNGMPIVLRAAMKPIPTLRNPLSSVDIITKKRFKAAYERSDICAVPSASIIAEAMTALVIADAFLEKFGGDSMDEVMRNYKGYMRQTEVF